MKSLPNAQAELDIHNYVGEDTCLSYQNVFWLLPETFQKKIKDLDKIFCTVTVISEDQSLDNSLRDEILKFIGRDPALDQASIALVRGRINPKTRQIEGNTHWTALNLKKTVTNGKISIQISHMDSSGGGIPRAVTRVINDIAKTDKKSLSQDLQASPVFQKAISLLPTTNFENPAVIKCARQTEYYSCGYHAVFNLVRMYDNNASEKIVQGAKRVNINQFIKSEKSNLQEQFNGAVLQAGTNFAQRASSKPVGDKKTSSELNINDLETARVCVFSIINEPNFGYLKKLEELLKIEQQLRAEGAFQEILSPLQIEKSYSKVIGEFSESIRIFISEKFKLDYALQNLFEELLQTLNSPDISNNLEKIMPFLSQFEIFFKNLKTDTATQDKDLEKLSKLLSEITKIPAEFLTKITQYTDNFRVANDSISNTHEEKKPKASPTKPLSAEPVIEVKAAKQAVERLVKGVDIKEFNPSITVAYQKNIASQKDKPIPTLPYVGIGFRARRTTQKINGNIERVMEVIVDFNSDNSTNSTKKRCKYKDGSNNGEEAKEIEIDLVGKFITCIIVKDLEDPSKSSRFTIEGIYENHEKKHGKGTKAATDAAKKEIASYFHGDGKNDNGEIEFEVYDRSINEIKTVSCKRDVYVTNNCSFAKDALGRKAEKGALYKPEVHDVSGDILRSVKIKPMTQRG